MVMFGYVIVFLVAMGSVLAFIGYGAWPRDGRGPATPSPERANGAREVLNVAPQH
jgi:hypothetical protein